MILARQSRFRVIAFLLSSALVFGFAPSAEAADQRVIDIAELTWTGAPRPSVSTGDVERSLAKVRTNWLSFTTLEGSANQNAIEFTFGRTLNAPLRLNAKFDCEATNFSTFINVIRAEAYKQLGINDYKDRYLTVLVPNSGCIWSGRALVGEAKTKGGSLVLHNTASAFIITHELGHSLGLGHSNLLRCASGIPDGPWSNDCKAIEYGGAIDVMGNVDTNSSLSVYHQWRMGLLEKSEIYQSWRNEKVTLTASDVKNGIRAVFLRDGNTSYWLEYRRPKSEVSYKPGIVIYRSDPPPSSFVESPNPLDSLQERPGPGISSDIWMLNLDAYTYSSTGRSSGSMTLGEGKSVTLYSKKISISFSAGKDANSVELSISRKVDQTPPPIPVLSDVRFWQFPEFPVLENGYTDEESAIAFYEIKRDEEVIKIEPDVVKDFSPTYLAPLSSTPILRVKDLPEGQYSLQVRAVDILGNVSEWSSSRRLSIDRGSPILSGGYRILEASQNNASIALTELRDPGSGLCETALINPEGIVVARSSAQSSPQFQLTPSVLTATKIQTFDCLGNGRQSSISAKYSFFGHKELRKLGKWKSIPNNPTALQCIGKCFAYFTTDGTIQAAVGSGSVGISVGGKEVARLSNSNSGTMRLSEPVTVGKVKRSVRIDGQNFTLYGLAKVSIQLGQISDVLRQAHPTDISLDNPAQVALSRFGFNSTDFEQGWFVLPMGGGTTLNDPTLDFCKPKYLSDEKRAERRQVAVSKVGSPYLFLSSEVVRYESEIAARSAMSELLETAKKCLSDGGGPEQSGVFTKYKFIPLPNTTEPYLNSSNSFTVLTTIGEDANARSLLAFYQFDRSMFTGLYVVTSGVDRLSDAEVLRWNNVAKVFLERLKQG